MPAVDDASEVLVAGEGPLELLINQVDENGMQGESAGLVTLYQRVVEPGERIDGPHFLKKDVEGGGWRSVAVGQTANFTVQGLEPGLYRLAD